MWQLAIAVSAALVGALAFWLVGQVRARIDGRKIYRWLKESTQDEPNKTHKDIAEIGDATRLTADRVRHACLRDRRIFQSAKVPGLYSIWRKEQRSVYEKRGILWTSDL